MLLVKNLLLRGHTHVAYRDSQRMKWNHCQPERQTYCGIGESELNPKPVSERPPETTAYRHAALQDQHVHGKHAGAHPVRRASLGHEIQVGHGADPAKSRRDK